jgi:hypothetical protein
MLMALRIRVIPRALRRRHLIAAALVLCSAAVAPTPSAASPIIFDGYAFTNFDLPGSGTFAGTGTNINGINNNGAAVGVSIANNGTFQNYIRHPDGTTSLLSLNDTAMAFGINKAGDVVGTQSGAAFFLPHGGTPQALAGPAGATAAFGINDHGNIVGQYSSGGASPGFFIKSRAGDGLITINAPSGPNVVNAQGINDNGLAVGFYLGTDGQDHGFMANMSAASGGAVTGTAIADPTIPSVAGEPGATFVFAQILGVNDKDIAVGYYGDSTTSQHGFLLNLNTDTYTFLDDPAMQFDNGVEVTQITGINNLGDIVGFYSDAAGIFHGFIACPIIGNGTSCAAPPVAEPGTLALECVGLAALGFGLRRRSRHV